MVSTRTLPLLALLALTTACATSPFPPVVEDVSGQAPIDRTPTGETVATETPGNVAPSRTDGATRTLLASAEAATDEDDHGTAIALLERAIRISPRDAQLWIRLSDSHLAAGNTAAARQHARKAIALAENNPQMTRAAWLQLADVLEAEGKSTEAGSIRNRYRSARG